MAAIDRAEVRRIASLAKLSLSEEEEEQLAGDLATILGYVKELEAVDVSGVDDAPPAVEALRPDVPGPGLSHEDAMKGAPLADEGAFVVPPFVE